MQDEIDRLTEENADLRAQLEHNATPQVKSEYICTL